MSAGPGFGNKTDDADPDLTEQHGSTRYDIAHTNAYDGGSETYGSGSISGPGVGNKSDAAGDGADLSEQHSSTRYDIAKDSAPYSGSGAYGSGTVGGPGIGNKTAKPQTDSRSGKLLEKVGSMTGDEEMVGKGKARRDKYRTNDAED